MIQVSYSADVTDLDRPAHEAIAERAGKGSKLRLQPTLLRQPVGAEAANYISWPGVSWSVDVTTAEELIGIRTALEAFFQALGRQGVEAVTHRLTAPSPLR